MLTAPPPLRPGDRVQVVACSGPVPEERFRQGLALLKDRFDVSMSDDLFRRADFLAGSDERRIEELNQAIRDPDVRCIWAARGGYGVSRLLPHLDLAAYRSDPKLVVGFSDLTALLAWVARAGFQSIHGPVVTQLGDVKHDVQHVFDLVQGRISEVVMRELYSSSEEFVGPVYGGNLCLMAHLCGSAWEMPLSGSICLLEDVGERGYALDRYATQLLLQSDGVANAALVLLGEFAECARDAEASATEILKRRFESAGLRVVEGAPVGHGSRNLAFPVGAQGHLVDGTLTIEVGK